MEKKNYNKMIEYFPSGASIIQDGMIVMTNKKFASLLEYEGSELEGLEFNELISSEQKDLARDLTDLNRAGSFKARMIKKNGIYLPKKIRLEPIDYQNKPALLCILSDERIPFDRIFENTDNLAVKGINSKHQLIYWNSASKSVFGYTEDEALGQKIDNLIVPKHLKSKFLQDIDNWFRNGEKIAASKQMWCNKDGDDVKLFSNYVMITTDSNAKLIFCIDVDITDLEGLGQHFWQIQRLKSIGNLSAGVAGKFNNILSVVQGRTQMAMMGSAEKKKRDSNLQNILDATHKATDVTRKLLLFSRKKEMQFRKVDLNETLENILRMKTGILDSDLELTSGFASDLRLIEGNRSYIEEMILNILANAKESMAKNGKLEIQTQNLTIHDEDPEQDSFTAPGKYSRIIIRDNGEGIPEDILSKIYDPFFTTKNEAEHEGLGLSVVYGIVKKHRGWINIKSEVGKATTVIIDLPAAS